MAYATTNDVQGRMTHTMTAGELAICSNLLDDCAVIIDAYNADASSDAKKIVSCRMVVRAIGDGGDQAIPVGATQGSMSALGYSQSWTIGAGSVGEVYLSKLDRKMLGLGNSIGSYSPVEELVPTETASEEA